MSEDPPSLFTDDVICEWGLQVMSIVTNSHFDAQSKLSVQSLDWKTIEQLIKRKVNLTVFKCLNGVAPKYLSDIFTKIADDGTHSLRDTNADLRLALKSSANGQKCFSFIGAKCWTSLSTEAKQASSKKRL